MSEKRKEIYARFGVQLTRNRRAFSVERKAPGAMGLYAFCVMYSRDELLDGFVPEEVALSAWGRPAEERGPQLDALVSVDLLERVEDGFRVVKYAEHNDTVAEVQVAREETRLRVAAFRDKKRGSTPPDEGDVTRYMAVTDDSVTRYNRVSNTPCNVDVPCSSSISFSDQEERSETRDQSTTRARDTRPDEVWAHYLSVRKVRRPNMRKATLDAKDRKAILEALKSYDVEALKLACEGLFLSSHHLGQNDRGTEYLGIEYAVKPRNIEGFIAAAQDAKPAPPTSRPMPVAESFVSAEDIEAVLAETTRRLGAS